MLPDKDGPGVGGGQSSREGEDPSVGLFREYLRLRTVHPDPDYGETASSQRWAVLSDYTLLCEFILNSSIDDWQPWCDDFIPKCSYHLGGLRFLWSQNGISMLVLEQMPALKRDMNAGGRQVCLSWLCSIVQMLLLGSWAGWRRSWACPWKRSRCDSVKQTVMLASLALENGTHSLPTSFGRHL